MSQREHSAILSTFIKLPVVIKNFVSSIFECSFYVGHPINSGNGLMSQKVLLKSEFYYPLLVAMGVAYSCLKYGVLSQPDLMLYRFVNRTVRAHGREKSCFYYCFLLD